MVALVVFNIGVLKLISMLDIGVDIVHKIDDAVGVDIIGEIKET